ncbi:MAG: putative toxin-antitoxin system toxin component, PIN family [Paludibacteraceae bacterium]|nr:putative toxin-antitoxin system toxin component, PIN family [Paludibacteraceae bacterium]MBQ6791270.1 putative toxin-antitoxin system toxin component, PIN family [Paludibacteraceae bacterium]MBQ6983635.1 putative toxin-antitoxin system toxin component, PIN family [Paludibacteraceae bacterium]
MRIIIDSNVWISFLLGFQKQLMRDVLENEHIDVYVCSQLTNEITNVATRSKISSRIADDDLEKLFRLINAYCRIETIGQQAVSSVRDSKDLYLLSSADTIEADYIVTGDNDLLVLNTHGKTRIVSPAQFKQLI